MMAAYYNEIDPAAAHILRWMVSNGVIAAGDVDERSIKEVSPDDLVGYTQCHFFAGGGLWSVAARLAGWPDDEPIWTGSCPCQPFSAAGKGGGTDDPRHLWPDFHRLIRSRRPPVIMGEQVAGAAGYGWFDGVSSDLEAEGFASRTTDFPACSIDAPHQRNRQYWVAMEVANRGNEPRWSVRGPSEGDSPDQLGSYGQPGRPDGGQQSDVTLGYGIGSGLEGYRGNGDFRGGSIANRSVTAANGGERLSPNPSLSVIQGQPSARNQSNTGKDEGLHADADRGGRAGRPEGKERAAVRGASSKRDLLRNGTYWSDAEWIACHDDKARRAKSGLRFLVDGLPGRIHLWRVGGNAIVPEAAKEVIASFIDVYGLPSEWSAAA